MTYIPTIPINDLHKVTFMDAHKDESETVTIMNKLNHICKDGNLFRNKHSITFLSENGQMKINTTVWMVGTNYVLMKENIYIPIESIINID